MKKFLFSFLASALFVVSGHGQTLNIGDTAPSASYKMMNIDGSQLSINDIKGENGALIIFTCNSCPFVVGRGETTEGWEGRYNGMTACVG